MKAGWTAWRNGSLWMASVVVGAVMGELVAVRTAWADVLCKRRSGVVVVRSPECKRREVRLDPATIQALDVQTVVSQRSAAGGLNEIEATCPQGYALTGGGAGIGSQDAVVGSSPSDTQPNTWRVIYYVGTPGVPIVAKALCARLNGATP